MDIFKFCYGEDGQFRTMVNILKSMGINIKFPDCDRIYHPRIVIFEQENTGNSFLSKKLFNIMYQENNFQIPFMNVYEDKGKEGMETITLKKYAVNFIIDLG